MKWPEDVRVAVNVSSVQFRKPGLANVLMQALAASGLDPRRLEVEITESIFLESSEALIAVLHSLRTMGIRIALDDFGTGYSSLSYLQSFPFDKIKIDRSFIQQIAEPLGLDRDRPRDHRSRPRARHGDDRRGGRESGAARRAAPPGLLLGPGLSVRRPVNAAGVLDALAAANPAARRRLTSGSALITRGGETGWRRLWPQHDRSERGSAVNRYLRPTSASFGRVRRRGEGLHVRRSRSAGCSAAAGVECPGRVS